jgi:hypothetical protein
MAKIIPNEQTMVRFATTLASTTAPTVAQVNAGVDLTPLLISITASATGNSVPTPSLDTLFETSIPGTSTASFTADFYRDDAGDTAWTTLPRGTKGFFIIQRWGANATRTAVAGQKVEVWPVTVTSRAAGPMTSNTAQTMTVACSVPVVPSENATVAA